MDILDEHYSFFDIMADIFIIFNLFLLVVVFALGINIAHQLLDITRLMSYITRISLSQLLIQEETLENSINTHIIDTHEDNGYKHTEDETTDGRNHRGM